MGPRCPNTVYKAASIIFIKTKYALNVLNKQWFSIRYCIDLRYSNTPDFMKIKRKHVPLLYPFFFFFFFFLLSNCEIDVKRRNEKSCFESLSS